MPLSQAPTTLGDVLLGPKLTYSHYSSLATFSQKPNYFPPLSHGTGSLRASQESRQGHASDARQEHNYVLGLRMKKMTMKNKLKLYLDHSATG